MHTDGRRIVPGLGPKSAPIYPRYYDIDIYVLPDADGIKIVVEFAWHLCLRANGYIMDGKLVLINFDTPYYLQCIEHHNLCAVLDKEIRINERLYDDIVHRIASLGE